MDVSRKREQEKQWRERNKHRNAFLNQRCNAKKRGIEWGFSYEEWLEWWGPDIERRGCGSGNIVMARQGDAGGYTADNVYKSTASANCRLAAEKTNREYWGR